MDDPFLTWEQRTDLDALMERSFRPSDDPARDEAARDNAVRSIELALTDSQHAGGAVVDRLVVFPGTGLRESMLSFFIQLALCIDTDQARSLHFDDARLVFERTGRDGRCFRFTAHEQVPLVGVLGISFEQPAHEGFCLPQYQKDCLAGLLHINMRHSHHPDEVTPADIVEAIDGMLGEGLPNENDVVVRSTRLDNNRIRDDIDRDALFRTIAEIVCGQDDVHGFAEHYVAHAQESEFTWVSHTRSLHFRCFIHADLPITWSMRIADVHNPTNHTPGTRGRPPDEIGEFDMDDPDEIGESDPPDASDRSSSSGYETDDTAEVSFCIEPDQKRRMNILMETFVNPRGDFYDDMWVRYDIIALMQSAVRSPTDTRQRLPEFSFRTGVSLDSFARQLAEILRGEGDASDVESTQSSFEWTSHSLGVHIRFERDFFWFLTVTPLLPETAFEDEPETVFEDEPVPPPAPWFVRRSGSSAPAARRLAADDYFDDHGNAC